MKHKIITVILRRNVEHDRSCGINAVVRTVAQDLAGTTLRPSSGLPHSKTKCSPPKLSKSRDQACIHQGKHQHRSF